MRRIFIKNIENFRDIGGYSISDNEIVKQGCLFRSNYISNLTSDEIRQLIKWNFTKVIDLRSIREVQEKPSIFMKDSNFSCINVSINGDGRIPESKEKVIDSYIEMLEGKEQIRSVFNILAETEENIIYYCNAGKDRTGVVTACILKLLGVCDDDIIVDYLSSGIYLKKMIMDFVSKEKKLYNIINPTYDTMYNLLRYIDNKYGNIEKYLISCNISNEKIKIIKNKYIKKYENL